MAMNAHEPELQAAVGRMEAAQREIERQAADGSGLGPAYEELNAAVHEYEAVVPKWRDEQVRG